VAKVRDECGDDNARGILGLDGAVLSWARVQANAALLVDIEREAIASVEARLAPDTIASVPQDWPGHSALEVLRLCVDIASTYACGAPGDFPESEESMPLADAGTPMQDLARGERRLRARDSRGLLYACAGIVRGLAAYGRAASAVARSAPWPWTSPAGLRNGADERLVELSRSLDVRARAGDPIASRLLVVLRAVRASPNEPPPRETRRSLMEEWNTSLAAVRTHARHIDVEARVDLLRAHLAAGTDPLPSIRGIADLSLSPTGVRVSFDPTSDTLSASDYGGAALFIVARRLPIKVQSPPLGVLGALIGCRTAARESADNNELLSEALRQLGCDPTPYVASLTSAKRKAEQRRKDREHEAAMKAGTKQKPRVRQNNGRRGARRAK